MKAPYFSLQDQDNKTQTLTDYIGRWVVVYFYPKDDTPGCTTEACNFRDTREAIAELGNAVIIGISKDSVASHKRFAEKHKLSFTLLSDPQHEVIEAYGAWGPRTFMGREFFGTHRNTYIIDPQGNIAKVYEGVSPTKHAAEIITDLQALQNRSDWPYITVSTIRLVSQLRSEMRMPKLWPLHSTRGSSVWQHYFNSGSCCNYVKIKLLRAIFIIDNGY